MRDNREIKQGIQLQRLGHLDRAATIYQKVLVLDPNNAEALHYLGLVKFQLGDLQVADELISRSLNVDRTCANTLSDLGMVKLKSENVGDSIPLFMRALELNPDHSDALNNLAVAFKRLNLYERALPLYVRLAKLRPGSTQVFCNLANTQYRTNNIEAAVCSYQEAIKLKPDNKQARIGLGEVYEAAGNFKRAKMQYLSVLRLDKNSPLALSKLIQMREGEIDPKWVVKAQELVENNDTNIDGKIRLNIALAYYFDRNNLFNKAFYYLKAGYDKKAKEESFDSNRYSKEIDSLIRELSATFFRDALSAENDSECPIFIVGMPRSGTTLTEQILASHSQVAPGGELAAMIRAAQRVQELSRSCKPYPFGLKDIGSVELTKLAEQYLKRLAKVSRSARMVTDKLPFNFFHLGLIALLFPNAKIIHCRRHPLDTCLSCYFTSFADEIKFANNLETLGRYYLDYHRLMRHWHEVLPVKIFDLEYERLVSDTEPTIRELLAYCRLDWEDACLTFYDKKGGVRTPSRWQVRQPIYSSSMGRWRNYEIHLEQLQTTLSPAIVTE